MLTGMPTRGVSLCADPQIPGSPVVYANEAYLRLTGTRCPPNQRIYVLNSQNCRWLAVPHCGQVPLVSTVYRSKLLG